MKCEFCGGTLSLEDEKCPHCGRLNPHAQKHIQEMKRYQGRFEKTKSRVYDITHTYARYSVRAVIICVLIMLIMIGLIAGKNAFSISSDIQVAGADSHFKEYSQLLDRYMEEGEFREIQAFYTARNIRDYEGPYEAYAPVFRAAGYYNIIFEYITHMICTEPEEMESEVAYLADFVKAFYEGLQPDKWKYYEGADRAENKAALQKMQEDLEALLTTYCFLTEEEIESLPALSSGRIAVMIEEAIQR